MSKQITVNGFSKQVVDIVLCEAILKQEPDSEAYGRFKRFSIDGAVFTYVYRNRSWQLDLEGSELRLELHDDGTNEIEAVVYLNDENEPANTKVTPEFKEAVMVCEDVVANREAIIEFLKQCDLEPYDPAQQPDTRLKYRNKNKLST
jgi:hypothetical protein